MAQLRTIAGMIGAMEYDEEIADDVRQEVEKHGTAQKIIDGELCLPHHSDARRHLDRKLGRETLTAKEREQQSRIAELEARLLALESRTPAEFQEQLAATEARLKALEATQKGGG